MLRIADIPRGYPLYNRVVNRHIEQFWQHTPQIVQVGCEDAAILNCPIDSTFALHRAGEGFRRLKNALRVYEPFEALHLDWYGDAGTDVYGQTSNPDISHWNNKLERERWEGEPLLWETFKAVRVKSDGGLEVHEVSLQR